MLSRIFRFCVLGFQTITTLILILGFQKWSPPGVPCDCGKGVLAMLSKIFRFCGLGFQKWSPPGVACDCGKRCACDAEQNFQILRPWLSDDHHPNSDPGISEMV